MASCRHTFTRKNVTTWRCVSCGTEMPVMAGSSEDEPSVTEAAQALEEAHGDVQDAEDRIVEIEQQQEKEQQAAVEESNDHWEAWSKAFDEREKAREERENAQMTLLASMGETLGRIERKLAGETAAEAAETSPAEAAEPATEPAAEVIEDTKPEEVSAAPIDKSDEKPKRRGGLRLGRR